MSQSLHRCWFYVLGTFLSFITFVCAVFMYSYVYLLLNKGEKCLGFRYDFRLIDMIFFCSGSVQTNLKYHPQLHLREVLGFSVRSLVYSAFLFLFFHPLSVIKWLTWYWCPGSLKLGVLLSLYLHLFLPWHTSD